jgi:hypothetical protein
MTHQDIVNGLLQLGFAGGWVITGNEISSWENETPQPTKKAIETAAAAYQIALDAKDLENATAKTALLARLGLTADEAKLLLS